MKVQDLMTRDVACCTPDMSLHDAARAMWDRDCGFVPVVEASSKRVCGVVTDRDACMAAYTTGRSLADLHVADAMASEVHTCRQKDDIASVHERMRRNQVRRLVVVDAAGAPVGVVSLNDLALAAQKGGRDESLELATTLGEISRHRSLAMA